MPVSDMTRRPFCYVCSSYLAVINMTETGMPFLILKFLVSSREAGQRSNTYLMSSSQAIKLTDVRRNVNPNNQQNNTNFPFLVFHENGTLCAPLKSKGKPDLSLNKIFRKKLYYFELSFSAYFKHLSSSKTSYGGKRQIGNIFRNNTAKNKKKATTITKFQVTN